MTYINSRAQRSLKTAIRIHSSEQRILFLCFSGCFTLRDQFKSCQVKIQQPTRSRSGELVAGCFHLKVLWERLGFAFLMADLGKYFCKR